MVRSADGRLNLETELPVACMQKGLGAFICTSDTYSMPYPRT